MWTSRTRGSGSTSLHREGLRLSRSQWSYSAYWGARPSAEPRPLSSRSLCQSGKQSPHGGGITSASRSGSGTCYTKTSFMHPVQPPPPRACCTCSPNPGASVHLGAPDNRSDAWKMVPCPSQCPTGAKVLWEWSRDPPQSRSSLPPSPSFFSISAVYLGSLRYCSNGDLIFFPKVKPYRGSLISLIFSYHKSKKD